ncbi:hypothetical protein K7X08_006723 [Anisodus acutangulus]|uniref:Uncharacterized protein n=1 Tax=Anisodus acutangulus TaxID=402998 RepID=A0A9Q1RRQ2_9SOLA|nr:hypothetical protein K7X08_006723 [Anisodus acutangulus]
MQPGSGPLPPHPSALEEELELQHRDMQRFLAENRHMIDENVMLERELSAVKDEMHRLSQVIPKMRADNEAQVREYIDRGMKLEADLRSTEPLRRQFEYEKKANTELVEQNQNMEKNLISMAREIEKLRAEKVGRGLGAGAYGMMNGNTEMRTHFHSSAIKPSYLRAYDK